MPGDTVNETHLDRHKARAFHDEIYGDVREQSSITRQTAFVNVLETLYTSVKTSAAVIWGSYRHFAGNGDL